MKFYKRRRLRRIRKARNKLAGYYEFDKWVAHLPPFLDREPRYDLHRAIRSAIMRGFRAESKRLRAEDRKLRVE